MVARVVAEGSERVSRVTLFPRVDDALRTAPVLASGLVCNTGPRGGEAGGDFIGSIMNPAHGNPGGGSLGVGDEVRWILTAFGRPKGGGALPGSVDLVAAGLVVGERGCLPPKTAPSSSGRRIISGEPEKATSHGPGRSRLSADALASLVGVAGGLVCSSSLLGAPEFFIPSNAGDQSSRARKLWGTCECPPV